jgi:hypothetical protein
MNYRVVQAEQVRTLEPKGDSPALVIDHLTLEANGTETLATAFRRPTTPIPEVGSTVEGELGDPDSFDKGRRKFKKSRPPQGGYRQRDPNESHRIEMQSARRDAVAILTAKMQAGKIKNFDLSDVAKATDALMRLLDPPAAPSDVPGDTEGLPPARDL